MSFDSKIFLNAMLGAAAAILLVEFVKKQMDKKETLENADDDYN
jgi:hypothetical protein